MTSDRTDHVVDLIDGAIDDWTSVDAMRWRPDGSEKPRPAPGLFASPRLADTVDRYLVGLFADVLVEHRAAPPVTTTYEDIQNLWHSLERQAYRSPFAFDPMPTPLLRVGQRVTVKRGPEGVGPDRDEEWTVLDVAPDGTATLASARTMDAVMAVGEPVAASEPVSRDHRPRRETPCGPARGRRR